ncbi:type II toxin-antitoxin system VapB family antitoxin [soil metagenome]
MVYRLCMTRTNIDIDDQAIDSVMRRFDLSTKREAVNFALRRLAAEPMTVEEARRMRGAGWEGDLEELRTSRTA